MIIYVFFGLLCFACSILGLLFVYLNGVCKNDVLSGKVTVKTMKRKLKTVKRKLKKKLIIGNIVLVGHKKKGFVFILELVPVFLFQKNVFCKILLT